MLAEPFAAAVILYIRGPRTRECTNVHKMQRNEPHRLRGKNRGRIGRTARCSRRAALPIVDLD